MTLCAISMITPKYDPKVGWSRLISVTGGNLPTYESFCEKFETVCPKGTFRFTNDDRVGNSKLTCDQLWEELTLAVSVWCGDTECDVDDVDREEAYNWCSSVLGILGWEWVLYVRHHRSYP